MTVSTTDSVVTYIAGGPGYAIPYRFLQNADIEAVLAKQDGTLETLSPTQYTIIGASSQNGGTLTSTYAASVLAVPGASLTISRIMTAVQPTDLRNQGRYFAETHENVFDRLTMLIQQGFAWTRRALLRPIGKDYYDAEGRRIANVSDPVQAQDAATMGWTDRFVGGLISAIQGPINNAANIFYQGPDGSSHVVQDLSGPDGSRLIGHEGGTVYSALTDAVTVASYAYKNSQALAAAHYKLRSGQSLKICCQGDSMTAGYDVQSADRVPADNGDWATHAPITYPIALSYLLGLSTGVTHTVLNRGYSGDTAKQSYNRWPANPDSDVIHLMLGINDAGGVAGATFDEYMEYMELLIQRFIGWGSGVVLHTVTPQLMSTANAGQRFGQAIRTLAEAYKCPVFEGDTVVLYSRREGVYSDSTHFNTQGYNKYGNAVAAFIMSGGWAQPVRRISTITQVPVTQQTDGVGVIARGAGVIAASGTGAIETNLAVGRILNENDRITFSFYSDTEFAQILFTGYTAGASVGISFVAASQYAGDDRGAKAVNQISTRGIRGMAVRETLGYSVPAGRARQGRPTLAGFLVGRGWKTVTIFTSATLGASAYLSSITIKPVSAEECARPDAYSGDLGELSGASDTVQVYQHPYIRGAAIATVPAAAALPATIYLPCPPGLLPAKSTGSSYFDSIPHELTITSNLGYVRALMRRASTANTLLVAKIAGDAAGDALLPTSATFVWQPYDEGVDGPAGVYTDGFATDRSNQFLKLTFGATTPAYYTLVLRGPSKASGYQLM